MKAIDTGASHVFSLFDTEADGGDFDTQHLKDLAAGMATLNVMGSSDLSGYVYLGQFVVHDISSTRPTRHRPVPSDDDPFMPEASATPALDLSNVYGIKTPESRHKTFVNPATGRMKLGPTVCTARGDLPRNSGRTADIADQRNDENLLIAQLHVLFLELHNFFMDCLQDEFPSLSLDELYARARQLVIHHYQEVVTHDLLFHLLDREVWNAIILQRRNIIWDTVVDATPVIPFEFALAAGRIGHSMVREDYRLNASAAGIISRRDLFSMTGAGGATFPLPDHMIVDWSFFFPDQHGNIRKHSNMAARLSPAVNINLVGIDDPDSAPKILLAEVTLLRGLESRLPSGQHICERALAGWKDALQQAGINLQPLSADALNLNDDNVRRNLLHHASPALVTNTPLWYYLLAEGWAAQQGRLGTLGSLVVAETIQGLLALDSTSIIHQVPCRRFITPTGKNAGTGQLHWQMADLIAAVEKSKLNPTKETTS